jgi:hypothetical protein
VRLILGLVCAVAVAGVAVGVVTACGGNAFVAGAGDASITDASADTAGGPSFCAIEGGSATFCADFDESTSLGNWTAIDQNGATIAVVRDPTAPSQPNSLESSVPSSVGTSVAQKGRVEKVFASASEIEISFQVHIDQVAPKPNTGGTSFVLVQLGDNTVGISANNLEVSYFEDVITDGGDTGLVVGNIISTPIALGTWVPAALDIDLTNATMTASVNGSSVGPIDITLEANAGQNAQVYLGIQSRNVLGTVGAHYDNVLINVTP